MDDNTIITTMSAPVEDDSSYVARFCKKFHRVGKGFSYTFWRTQIGDEVFWSIQGHEECGSVWIVTQYFGAMEEARRYQQEVTLHHPTEAKIKIDYASVCTAGRNCIKISKEIMHYFRNEENNFDFEFRIVKLKRNPFPQRNL